MHRVPHPVLLGKPFTPNEILLPVVLEDADVRAELLAERKGKRAALTGDTLSARELGHAEMYLNPSNEYRV